MTTKKTRTVAKRLVRLGRLSLIKACWRALILSLLTRSEWKRAMMAPSYSKPCSVLWVIGEKDFHMMLSQILIAMKSDVPLDPIPYPLDNNSSIMIMMTAEKTN
jgi:hypothetical protein